MLRAIITHIVTRSPIVLLALPLAGCALFGGGSETRVASMKRSDSYTVKAPGSWKGIDKADSDSAYRTSSGSIATITSSCDRDATQPLELLTKHLLIGARKVQTAGTERILVGRDTGLFNRVKAELEGRAFELLLFVITHNNCIFDFSLVHPKGVSESDGIEFRTFIRSLSHAN